VGLGWVNERGDPIGIQMGIRIQIRDLHDQIIWISDLAPDHQKTPRSRILGSGSGSGSTALVPRSTKLNTLIKAKEHFGGFLNANFDKLYTNHSPQL
jgi:hypothetical protein